MATTTANGAAKRTNEVKNAATKAASVATTKTEADEKALALKKELEEKTAALQEALRDLNRKKELSDHRSRFLATLEELSAVEEELNKEDGFTATSCKLVFSSTTGGRYGNGDNICSIGQAALIREFVKFIREKIKIKVESIEAELVR